MSFTKYTENLPLYFLRLTHPRKSVNVKHYTFQKITNNLVNYIRKYIICKESQRVRGCMRKSAMFQQSAKPTNQNRRSLNKSSADAASWPQFGATLDQRFQSVPRYNQREDLKKVFSFVLLHHFKQVITVWNASSFSNVFALAISTNYMFE